jgi:hypothetical protein
VLQRVRRRRRGRALRAGAVKDAQEASAALGAGIGSGDGWRWHVPRAEQRARLRDAEMDGKDRGHEPFCRCDERVRRSEHCERVRVQLDHRRTAEARRVRRLRRELTLRAARRAWWRRSAARRTLSEHSRSSVSITKALAAAVMSGSSRSRRAHISGFRTVAMARFGGA